MEIEIAKQDYEPHLVRPATVYHDLYIDFSYDNLVDHSHIDQTYIGPMLRDFGSKLPLDEEIHSTPACSHEHNNLRKPEELAGIKIDDIPPLTQKQDEIMDQLIKQLPISHLDNNFKFDMGDHTIHSSDIHPPSHCEHKDTIIDTHDSHLYFPWIYQYDQENNIPMIKSKPNLISGNAYLEPMNDSSHQTLTSTPNSLWNHAFFIIPSYLHDSWNHGSLNINIGYQLDQCRFYHGHNTQVNFCKCGSNCKNYPLDLGDENHITDNVMTVDSTF